MKKLPIGLDDFKKLREKDYYFVDKSLFIKDILEESAETILFPRPRRFGKSLNMSMLKYFFDNRKAEENRALFQNLKIAQEEDFLIHQGQYPVIYLSFKDIKTNSWEKCLSKIKLLIKNLFREYKHLLNELDEFDAADLRRFILGDFSESELEDSLRFLSQLLSEHYDKKVYILIDEYDQPIISSYMENFFDEGINFFRNFYGSALKGNPYLEKGILTGILRIAKESIFSGLNNLYVDSILKNQINHFGLSEKEVEEILDHHQMTYRIDQVKEWYNGYKFGNDFVYNPWSIINFVREKELRAYWVNTSSNKLIKYSLNKINRTNYSDILDLLKGGKLDTPLDENISFDSLKSATTIWNLMLFSGYLTLGEGNKLRFANREIKEFYINIFEQLASNNDVLEFQQILNYLVNKEFKLFEKILRELFLKALSFYDTDTEAEKYYHNLILGMAFGLESRYIIHSNREYGTGRVDLLLKAKDEKLPDFIFEFKVSSEEKDLEKLAEEALNQIEDKKYAIELESPVKIGMAFYKKEFVMIWKD